MIMIKVLIFWKYQNIKNIMIFRMKISWYYHDRYCWYNYRYFRANPGQDASTHVTLPSNIARVIRDFAERHMIDIDSD